MQGRVPGGRGRLGQLPWRDYVYRGAGYDTLTESPGERAIRLRGRQQWRRVKQPDPPVPATPVGATGLDSKPEVVSVGSSPAKDVRCEGCGYLVTSKSHEVVCG